MTSTAQFANPAAAPDDEMEKIRELLVGNLQRRVEALEEEIGRRFDEVAIRIDALGRETTAGRHAAFEELSRNIMELGERIKGLSRG